MCMHAKKKKLFAQLSLVRALCVCGIFSEREQTTGGFCIYSRKKREESEVMGESDYKKTICLLKKRI